eukprot:CFRG5897T1
MTGRCLMHATLQTSLLAKCYTPCKKLILRKSTSLPTEVLPASLYETIDTCIKRRYAHAHAANNIDSQGYVRSRSVAGQKGKTAAKSHASNLSRKKIEKETAEDAAMERMSVKYLKKTNFGEKKTSSRPQSTESIFAQLQSEYGNRPPKTVLAEAEAEKLDEVSDEQVTGWENIHELKNDECSVNIAPAYLPPLYKGSEIGLYGDESKSGAEYVSYEQDLSQWTVPPQELYDTKNQPKDARTLSVALVGGANTGKSTLINQLMETKLCMVSPVSQTTIQRQLGVFTHGNSQIQFYDTPGFINKQQRKSWRLPQSVSTDPVYTAREVDIVAMMMDVSLNNPIKQLNFLSSNLDCDSIKRAILIVNKVDVIKSKRDFLLPLVREALATSPVKFEKVFFISALTNDGVDEVKEYFREEAKPGDWEYSPTQTTDTPPLTRVEEVLREKLMGLGHELPYTTRCNITRIRRSETGDMRINVDVIVRRKSQIAIVVGKRGSRIVDIANKCKMELSSMFDSLVDVEINVKT